VRGVIDELESKELINGFVTGKLNRRGVVAKSPFEGGLQERALVKSFFDNAAACDNTWPVTARALRQIAQHYEDYAKREDEEAEARRIGR